MSTTYEGGAQEVETGADKTPPKRLCKAIVLRTFAVMRLPVSPASAEALGAPILNPDSLETSPELAGIVADCTACEGCVFVDVDRLGRLAAVSEVVGQPSFADTCTMLPR